MTINKYTTILKPGDIILHNGAYLLMVEMVLPGGFVKVHEVEYDYEKQKYVKIGYTETYAMRDFYGDTM